MLDFKSYLHINSNYFQFIFSSELLRLPRTCSEVAEKESGSYLIRPSYDIAPFHAYCNFNENPGMNYEKLQK